MGKAGGNFALAKPSLSSLSSINRIKKMFVFAVKKIPIQLFGDTHYFIFLQFKLSFTFSQMKAVIP